MGAPDSAVAVDQISELHHRGFALQTFRGGTGYHTKEFVRGLREQGAVPHPAREHEQETLHFLLTRAQVASLKVRKPIEVTLGWAKTTGCSRKKR